MSLQKPKVVFILEFESTVSLTLQMTSPQYLCVTMVDDYDDVGCTNASEGLNYPSPDIGSLALCEYMNEQEKEVLMNFLPGDSEQWLELAADQLMAFGILDEEEEGEY